MEKGAESQKTRKIRGEKGERKKQETKQEEKKERDKNRHGTLKSETAK